MQSKRMAKKPQNALVHGVYASDVILPGENVEEFDAMLDGLRKEFRPTGVLEEQLVFEIAHLQWKKARANRYAQVHLLRCRFIRDVKNTAKHTARGIARALDKHSNAAENPHNQLRDAIATLQERCQALSRRFSFESLAERIEAVISELNTLEPIVKLATTREIEEGAPDALTIIERANKLEAQLDAQIERKTRQLVMTKEFARLYTQSPKLIEHKPAMGHTSSKTISVRSEAKLASTQNDNNDENNDWNNDNDNDEPDPRDYDWEKEYDEAMKEWKKKRSSER
jgi:hypothetical protein